MNFITTFYRAFQAETNLELFSSFHILTAISQLVNFLFSFHLKRLNNVLHIYYIFHFARVLLGNYG